MIPYGRQDVTQRDIDAVVEVLRSDFLTQGPVVPRFEQAVATHVNVQNAIAVNSATSALHVACIALGLGAGDRLWTTPNTYIASANCGRYCGADVDFVDIDKTTWNMSLSALREKLVLAEKNACLPKIVVPVHFAGQPTEQEAIWSLAEQYGFKVLEDASHSIGATRNSEPVGSCRWSDITVFSFHPVKIITCGEGGMALTNSAELTAAMALARNHGVTRDIDLFQNYRSEIGLREDDQCGPPAWYYEQHVLGYNYRMTDIAAALGLSQLQRLRSNIDRRSRLARRYSDALTGLPLDLPQVSSEAISAYHLYVVRLRKSGARRSHREVFDELRRRGIGVNLHYIPVHLQPYYREMGFAPGDFPESEAYSESAISLPLYPGLTEDQQDEVIRALKDLL